MDMTSVIVLDAKASYWDEVDIGKVINWILKGKVRILVEDEKEKVKCSLDIYRPVVVQLLKFIGYKPKTEQVKWNKEAVFKRDGNICQFWHFDEKGHKFKYKCKPEEVTLEHLVPKSRGGAKDSFLNCVCACKRCNVVVKGNKTPEEAGLKLIRQPFIPKRNRNEFVRIDFNYNPDNLAHRIYMEKVLGG
jgi:5-methylcytosine-specific restriction endonuclease McrA